MNKNQLLGHFPAPRLYGPAGSTDADARLLVRPKPNTADVKLQIEVRQQRHQKPARMATSM